MVQTSTASVTATEFRLFTASVSGAPVTLQAAVYADMGSRPGPTPLRTTTMTVGGSPGFYTATLSPPLVMPGGSRFFVALSHNNAAYLSGLSRGVGRLSYFDGPGGWTLSSASLRSAVQVVCQGFGGNATPEFDLAGSPNIGQALAVNLSNAAANVPATLLIGTSNTMTGGLPLPVDLGVIGASGCSLLVGTQASLGYTTDNAGAVSATLQIPSDPTLAGYNAFLQFFIVDFGANNLGLVSTEANQLIVGG